MGPPEWIAAIATVGGLAAWVIGLTYKAGRHAEKLEAAQAAIGKLQTRQDEHATAIAAWSQAVSLLEEVRQDVKDLLTGASPASRRRRRDAAED